MVTLRCGLGCCAGLDLWFGFLQLFMFVVLLLKRCGFVGFVGLFCVGGVLVLLAG